MALGIDVLEAWGMSETSAVTTVNPAAKPRFGTVGKAIPGTEVTLDDDGEVLVRGAGVMRAYHRDPEKTASTIDSDGWVHTGDIGSLDEEGYLTIVDRKKELIINDGGKNISPANIEGALKAASTDHEKVRRADRCAVFLVARRGFRAQTTHRAPDNALHFVQ